MTKRIGLILLCLLAGLAQAGQMYRWVDADGKVHYTDQPPPASVKNVEEKNLGGGSTIETSELPYAAQQAVKNFPVTLYVSDCGKSCDSAREHLRQRGIPYTSKNPQSSKADYDALKKLVGEGYVPVLVVGTAASKGYNKEAWDAALDNAGYPKSLPSRKSGAGAQTENGGAAGKPAEGDNAPSHPWAK